MKLRTTSRLASVILPATAIVFACGQKAQAIATQLPNNGLLESWEPPVDGNDPANGWYIPSWGSYGSNENATSEATGSGGPATDGVSSLEVDDPNTNGGFAWEVGYQTFGGSEQNNGAAFLAQFDQAVTNNAGNYNMTFDVIYKAADIPASPSSVQFPYINGSLLFQWSNQAVSAGIGAGYAQAQVDNIALADPTTDSVQHVSIPLTTFSETSGGTTFNLGDDPNIYWVQMYLAINGSFNAGSPVTVFYDNLRITPKILGDVNGDGVVDGTDLATIQANMGQSVQWGYASGDFNGDGVVNADDQALFDLGLALYGSGASAPAPEPTMLAATSLFGLSMLRRRR
jgi:Dockerin type I domain